MLVIGGAGKVFLNRGVSYIGPNSLRELFPTKVPRYSKVRYSTVMLSSSGPALNNLEVLGITQPSTLGSNYPPLDTAICTTMVQWLFV